MSGLSLGIGLTNACDRACSHCYRPQGPLAYLGVRDVERCLDTFDVGSVNLGTGENILAPELGATLDLLADRGVRTSLTSNGRTLLELDEARLRRLHDVEVSFDFATREEMDAFRGAGAWDTATRAVGRVVGLGLKVTLLAVMMRNNYGRLAAVARLASSLGGSFRVNVYQPVHGHAPMPSFVELWEGFRRLLAETDLVACTEPVVAAVLQAQSPSKPNGKQRGGCGHASVRLTPAGEILPCVYWPRPAGQLHQLGVDGAREVLDSHEFASCRLVPDACRDCALVERCGGGCASRRALTVGVDKPDPYCPMAQGQPVELSAELGGDIELLHASNLCTTIVRAD